MADKLRERRDRYAAKRKRQLTLFAATKRRGNARKAAQYGRIMRKLSALIEKADVTPTWKLAWAARFIAPWEGLRTTAYLDSGGIPTIGYGHTGPDVRLGMTISKARALALLTSDLREAARAVARNVKVPLSARERIAAISFTFNVGEGGLQSSTFLRELNAGNRRAAADALLLWVKDADGNTLLGLQRRRRLERWLFLNPRK
jgi:lysozyme